MQGIEQNIRLIGNDHGWHNQDWRSHAFCPHVPKLPRSGNVRHPTYPLHFQGVRDFESVQKQVGWIKAGIHAVLKNGQGAASTGVYDCGSDRVPTPTHDGRALSLQIRKSRATNSSYTHLPDYSVLDKAQYVLHGLQSIRSSQDADRRPIAGSQVPLL